MSNEQDNRLTPADAVEDLSHAEQRAVDYQSRPGAALIHETIRAEGEKELERDGLALTMSGFAAGLSIGFSVLVPAFLYVALPDTSWRGLIVSLGYTVGFLIVVLGRQQLFTENTLTPVLGLLRRARSGAMFLRLMRLWGIVLASNIAATWCFAAVVAFTSVIDEETRAAMITFSQSAIAYPFGTTMIKAAFAGWLIALMVWLLPAVGSARPFIIIIITYIVSIAHLSHVIAGSVEAAFLVLTASAGMKDYVITFFIPTLIGNIIGGVALVAALNFGQVAPELRDKAGGTRS